MRKILEESGLRIPYEEDASYMIEKSPLVTKLQSVKIVEFVQALGIRKIVLLEAKTTAPCQDNHDDYNVYMTDIREKFQNSISLLNAAKLKRRPEIYDELPQPLKNIDYKGAHYWLYLVIKQYKEDWIVNINNDLHRQLHPFLKCWNIPDANFEVLNEGLARSIGIVE